MKRVALIEDDGLMVKVWRSILSQTLGTVTVSAWCSVEQASLDLIKNHESWSDFDFLVVDIFLSGDKTGIDFIANLPSEVQQRTILSSSVPKQNIQSEISERKLKCLVVVKPLEKGEVNAALNIILRGENRGLVSCEKSSLQPNAKAKAAYKPVIMVTGCSSGVGEALAKLLAENINYRVVLTAREKSLVGLREKYGDNNRIMILPLDLTSDVQIEQQTQNVVNRWGRIDILVNNAGMTFRGVVEQMDSLTEELQMKTNYLGPMAMIRSVVPMMRENGRGKIINVSSVSGFMGMPTMGSYSASKHALEGASECLWYELAPLGINISVVRPGFINSEGHQHVLISPKARMAEKLDGPYADFYHFMRPFVTRLMRLSPASSESVAAEIMKVIHTQNPGLWHNATLDAHIFCFLKKVLPIGFFHKFINFGFSRASSCGRGYSNAQQTRLTR